MAKKKIDDKALKVSSLVGKKLEDASNTPDGEVFLHFSNGMRLKIKGDVLLVVEKDEKKKVE